MARWKRINTNITAIATASLLGSCTKGGMFVYIPRDTHIPHSWGSLHSKHHTFLPLSMDPEACYRWRTSLGQQSITPPALLKMAIYAIDESLKEVYRAYTRR